MKNYDNNIDMFDAYLNNLMSDDEKRSFEQRLNNEPEFKKEFKEYKQMIFLIQESCAEANQEFEQAMKNISDDTFKDVVSTEKEDSAHVTLADDEAAKPKGRVIPLKKVYQWMSIAAMLVVIAGVGMNIM